MMTYPMHVAGLVRDLPICKVTEDFYIGAFIMFGDAELTVACARDLLKLAEELDYDYLLTAEAKSIPLIHEMARQSGAEKYFIARKGPKVYMPDPISVEDRSITTLGVQQLFLGRDDADLINGKKILIVDDVISTGGSLHAMETLVAKAGGTVAAAWPSSPRATPRTATTSSSSRRCRPSRPTAASAERTAKQSRSAARMSGAPLFTVLLSGRLRRGSDAAAVPAALGQQVGERNAVEIVVDERVELLPDGQREALGPRAGRCSPPPDRKRAQASPPSAGRSRRPNNPSAPG